MTQNEYITLYIADSRSDGVIGMALRNNLWNS